MPEIPATFGSPYSVSLTKTGLVRVARVNSSGRETFIVFDRKAAIAVADAMVDAVEAE